MSIVSIARAIIVRQVHYMIFALYIQPILACKTAWKISHSVFSTGATGAIAPVILRKRPIAPVILHLPYSVIIFYNLSRLKEHQLYFESDFKSGKLLEKKFALRAYVRTYLLSLLRWIINIKSSLITRCFLFF